MFYVDHSTVFSVCCQILRGVARTWGELARHFLSTARTSGRFMAGGLLVTVTYDINHDKMDRLKTVFLFLIVTFSCSLSWLFFTTLVWESEISNNHPSCSLICVQSLQTNVFHQTPRHALVLMSDPNFSVTLIMLMLQLLRRHGQSPPGRGESRRRAGKPFNKLSGLEMESFLW